MKKRAKKASKKVSRDWAELAAEECYRLVEHELGGLSLGHDAVVASWAQMIREAERADFRKTLREMP